MVQDLINIVQAVFSIIASAAALWAGIKAHNAYKLVRGVLPSYDKVTPMNKRRLKSNGLFSSPQNASADADTVADKIDGVDAAGQQIAFRKWAFGYVGRPFGLAIDYVFPEGPNVSSSMADADTSLVKLLGRKFKMPDGNEADALDMIYYSAKKAALDKPSLMADEVHSMNYKRPSGA